MTIKKISFFLPRILHGGLTQVMLTLASAIIDRGYKVDIVTIHEQWPHQFDHLLPCDANLILLPESRPFLSIWPLANYLKKAQADVLITAGSSANNIASLARLLAQSPTKIILTEHSEPSADVFKSEKVSDRIIPFLMKRLYSKADAVVAVSHNVAKDLSSFIKYPLEKIHVIYNPIISQKLTKLSFDDISHPWFSNKQTPIILFVGRLVEMKNIQLLLNAFSIVNESAPSKLVLIGEGPEKEKLISLINELKISKNVLFLDYCINPYAYMRQSDVLVLTSKWEGLPTVLIEAMACGTQVIATDNLNGAKEILNNGKFGTLTPNNNAEMLAENIMKVITYGKQPENVKKRADQFSVDASVDQYLSLFNS